MFEVLFKHFIYEKCINLIFNRISKAFKKPDPKEKYQIISVKNTKTFNGFTGEIYIIKHKGKFYTITMLGKKNIIDAFVKIHGYSKEAAEIKFHDILTVEIERQIRCEDERYKKEME